MTGPFNEFHFYFICFSSLIYNKCLRSSFPPFSGRVGWIHIHHFFNRFFLIWNESTMRPECQQDYSPSKGTEYYICIFTFPFFLFGSFIVKTYITSAHAKFYNKSLTYKHYNTFALTFSPFSCPHVFLKQLSTITPQCIFRCLERQCNRQWLAK